jgi:hypothetical protein
MYADALQTVLAMGADAERCGVMARSLWWLDRHVEWRAGHATKNGRLGFVPFGRKEMACCRIDWTRADVGHAGLHRLLHSEGDIEPNASATMSTHSPLAAPPAPRRSTSATLTLPLLPAPTGSIDVPVDEDGLTAPLLSVGAAWQLAPTASTLADSLEVRLSPRNRDDFLRPGNGDAAARAPASPSVAPSSAATASPAAMLPGPPLPHHTQVRLSFSCSVDVRSPFFASQPSTAPVVQATCAK